MDEWLNDVTTDDIPENFRELAEKIGVKNLLIVMSEFEGIEVYFPKLDGQSGFINIRNKVIKREYKKRNGVELAKKFNVTLAHLRTIVGEDERQTTLF